MLVRDSLASPAAVRGYRIIITMPEKMSQEKQVVLEALGHQVALLIPHIHGGLIDPPKILFLDVAPRPADQQGRVYVSIVAIGLLWVASRGSGKPMYSGSFKSSLLLVPTSIMTGRHTFGSMPAQAV